MINIAFAMGQGGAAGGGQPGGFTAFIPLIIMFAIFYFLLIRPQQKKSKQHREMISALKKGDRVVTSGGIHGRITSADDNTVTVEIADRVRIKINRGNIAALNQPSQPQPSVENKAD
ncbi:MAG: preprotein translocase subunit YajC [Deltaproteobacteria bacterium]|nr:MAG: preprotein translocase subunit YajC [Deltaproteobacteria bacterium]